MIVKLPIFHTTDESEKKKIIGIDYDLEEDTEKRDVIFFDIKAISEYRDNGKKFTSIHSNSTEFICALSIDKVLEEIDKQTVENYLTILDKNKINIA